MSRQSFCIILICGLPGSGKSTVAKILAKKLSATVLRTDVIRKEIFPANTPRNVLYSADSMNKTYREMTERAVKLAQETTVILDATFSKRSNRQYVYEEAKNAEVLVRVILVKAPDDLAEKWLMKRMRHGRNASQAGLTTRLEHKQTFQTIHSVHKTIYNAGGRSTLVKNLVRYLHANKITLSD